MDKQMVKIERECICMTKHNFKLIPSKSSLSFSLSLSSPYYTAKQKDSGARSKGESGGGGERKIETGT